MRCSRPAHAPVYNAQIASTLQISLDGAKWHVSEITKLGVDPRDEAADYWRTPQRDAGSALPGCSARWRRERPRAAGWRSGRNRCRRWLRGGDRPRLALDDTAPPSNPDVPSTPTSIPQGGSGGRTVLSNGATDYDYIPALAYVAPGGQARLVDAAALSLPPSCPERSRPGSAARAMSSMAASVGRPTAQAPTALRIPLSIRSAASYSFGRSQS